MKKKLFLLSKSGVGLLITATIMFLLAACSGGGGDGSTTSTTPAKSLSVSTPERISSDTNAVHETPVVLFDSTGTNGMAVWTVNSGVNTKIVYSYYSGAAGSWSAEADLAVGDVLNPQIATNDSTFMVVWRNTHEAYGSTSSRAGLYAREFNGASWGTEVVIGQGEMQTIASNGSGYLAAWRRENEMHAYDLYASVFDGSNWEDSASLSPIQTGGSDDRNYEPRIVSDGTDYMMVWHQVTTTSVYAQKYDSLTGWEAADALSSGAGVALARVASNGAGSFAAVWCNAGGNVGASTYNGTWSGAETIGGGLVAPDFDLELTSNGTGYAAAWLFWDAGNTRYDVYSALHNGTIWAAAAEIDGLDSDASAVQITSNGSGYAATWHQGDDIHSNIGAGWSWSSPGLVESGAGIADSPLITSQGSGYTAIWQRRNTTGVSGIYTANHSGTWSAEDNLVTAVHRGDCVMGEAGIDDNNLDMASNDSGLSMAVWEQYDNGTKNLYFNTRNGGVWGTATKLADDSRRPKIASNGTGFAVFWQQNDGAGNYEPWARIYNGSSWETALMVGNGVNNETNYAIESDGAGYVVFWKHYNSGAVQTTLYANVYDSTWSGPTAIGFAASGLGGLDVASDGSSYIVVWSQATAPTQAYVYYNHYDSINGWSLSPSTIGSGLVSVVYYLQVASNSSNYLATWHKTVQYGYFYEAGAWTQDLYTTTLGASLAMSASGTGYMVLGSSKALEYSDLTWGTETAFFQNYSSAPKSAASNGAGYAVMLRVHDPTYQVHANIFTGGGWRDATRVDNAPGNEGEAAGPVVSFDGTEYVAAWLQNTLTSIAVDDIYSATISQ